MYAEVGERFEMTVSLDVDSVIDFARRVHDLNPLHRDSERAARSRFGGLIACGPQYASIFMGMAATHFSARGLTLGLEFSFQFKKAVRPDDTLRFQCEVVAVSWNEKLGGDIVTLNGTVTNRAAEAVLLSAGKMLVAAPL
jgi:3-hydroxybutyryl-CoA dehydratase